MDDETIDRDDWGYWIEDVEPEDDPGWPGSWNEDILREEER